MYAEDTRLSYGLRQHIQMLTEQVEQQKQEIELITAQMRILKDQLKIETQARFESQVKFVVFFSLNLKRNFKIKLNFSSQKIFIFYHVIEI